MTVFLFVSLLVMLAASVPIFIALCGSVTASFLLFSNMDTTIIIQRMFAGINKFSLMSIPLFVLAANLMSEGGISKRIINLANAFVGHIPGGLGMTAILASMFFGAISGSSPATVVCRSEPCYTRRCTRRVIARSSPQVSSPRQALWVSSSRLL